VHAAFVCFCFCFVLFFFFFQFWLQLVGGLSIGWKSNLNDLANKYIYIYILNWSLNLNFY
jgi:hypothetical protein